MSLLEETNAVEDADDNISTAIAVLDTSTIHVNILDTPTDWQPPNQKVAQGEPNFIGVDNPGEWS